MTREQRKKKKAIKGKYSVNSYFNNVYVDGFGYFN